MNQNGSIAGAARNRGAVNGGGKRCPGILRMRKHGSEPDLACDLVGPFEPDREERSWLERVG